MLCETDLQVLNSARNKVSYDPSYKNSLVSWTLSDVWCTAPDKTPIRGLVNIRGLLKTCNETSGEIDV